MSALKNGWTDVADALTDWQHRCIDKVVVLAVSNGATLATSMLDHPAHEPVDTLVITAKLRTRRPESNVDHQPGGPLLLQIIAGRDALVGGV